MSCTLCFGRDVAKIVHGKLQSINGNLGMVLTTWCMGKGVMYFVFMGAVQCKWCMRNGVVVNTMFNIMSLGKNRNIIP